MIEITSIGGYGEFGKNMTLIRVDDEFVILDMGLHLENYINLTEDEDLIKVSRSDLERVEAIPKTKDIRDIKDFVKGIVVTHAHLDHIGALPFLAKDYKCPIICTPYTGEVIRTIYTDERINIKNKIHSMLAGNKLKISKNIEVEFINVTHSTPQVVIASINTKYGSILYANDFKLDYSPTLGNRPDVSRLKEFGQENNCLALICDSSYSAEEEKAPSEKEAEDLLREVFEDNEFNNALVISTFSSHLARLNSIIKLARKFDRKILFLGRSLYKYIEAGERVGIVDFSKESERYKYRNEVHKMLRKVMKHGKEKYILVATGHQGEPKAILSRMANDDTPFTFSKGDVVIFSSSTIPVETNIKNTDKLVSDLKSKGVKVFRDVHVSGHATQEDLRQLIKMVKPLHLIPSHGEISMLEGIKPLAKELKYDKDRIHILLNGKSLKID